MPKPIARDRPAAAVIVATGSDPDPAAALERWLLRFIEYASTFRGLATTLVGAVPAGETPLCARIDRGARALVERAVAAGQLRSGLVVEDVLHLAASLAWLAESAPGDDHRIGRMLSTWMAGART